MPFQVENTEATRHGRQPAPDQGRPAGHQRHGHADAGRGQAGRRQGDGDAAGQRDVPGAVRG